MSVQLLSPNTSGAVFWLLSPGCAPQQSDPARPVRSPFPEHICREGEHRAGDVPCRRDRRIPTPAAVRGWRGGASRSALTAGNLRDPEGKLEKRW